MPLLRQYAAHAQLPSSLLSCSGHLNSKTGEETHNTKPQVQFPSVHAAYISDSQLHSIAEGKWTAEKLYNFEFWSFSKQR